MKFIVLSPKRAKLYHQMGYWWEKSDMRYMRLKATHGRAKSLECSARQSTVFTIRQLSFSLVEYFSAWQPLDMVVSLCIYTSGSTVQTKVHQCTGKRKVKTNPCGHRPWHCECARPSCRRERRRQRWHECRCWRWSPWRSPCWLPWRPGHRHPGRSQRRSWRRSMSERDV